MSELTSQWPAGEPVVKPSGAFLSACAALNWIAFRRAEDGDLTGHVSLWGEFGYEPHRPPGFNAFDYAVAEAADMLTPHHRAVMQDFVTRMEKEPRDLLHARKASAQALADRGWQPWELHIYLEARRETWARRTERLWAAQHQLTSALAAERITAFATRALEADPQRGLHSPRPTGLAMAVPWQYFLTPGAIVQPSGAITASTDPGYLHTQLRTAEVLEAWPLVLEATAGPLQGIEPSVGPPRRLRGRSFRDEDAPLLDEMASLIRAGHARGPMDAAMSIASKAKGKTPDAIVKRLARKFNERIAAQSAQSGHSIGSL